MPKLVDVPKKRARRLAPIAELEDLLKAHKQGKAIQFTFAEAGPKPPAGGEPALVARIRQRVRLLDMGRVRYDSDEEAQTVTLWIESKKAPE